MNEIKEIKIPEGVESISVTQYDDKIVFEFIPKEAKFKEGDFVYEDERIMIVKSYPNEFHAIVWTSGSGKPKYNGTCGLDFSEPTFRHASDVEKQILIDAMKKDGKRWNAEKLKIEDVLKKGDLAIFWEATPEKAFIRLYNRQDHGTNNDNWHIDNLEYPWRNAIKFESKEQFEKILRGEI